MKKGLILLCIILTASLLAPILTRSNALDFKLSQKLQGPSLQHFLGTDENGSDVFSKILYGGRLSLFVAFSVVIISSFVGLIFGTIAGYFEGISEMLLMRLVDMLQAFPGFLLALAIIAFMGSSTQNVIFALCFTGWTAYARLVRAEIQSLKQREFVLAAHSVGVTDFWIIVRHLWPNLMAVLVVQMSFGLAGAVISEAGLSFLGLGAPPGTPSWGALLSSGRRYLIAAPQLSLFPGLAILILVLGFNLLGDGLGRHFNPKGNQ